MSVFTEFLARRPSLEPHCSYEGTYGQWSRAWMDGVAPRRGGRLGRLVMQEAALVYGDRVDIPALAAQLERWPLASTADHGGILNHSLLWHSNLLYAGLCRSHGLGYQVVLASGRVPLNNVSWPRGFEFRQERISFYPERYKRSAVVAVRDPIPREADGMPSGVRSWTRRPSAARDDVAFMEALWAALPPYHGAGTAWAAFARELGPLNRAFWPLLFDAASRPGLPGLVYLFQEPLVEALLLDDLARSDSLLSRILFDPEVRSAYLAAFEGIAGCWGGGRGTHFFWEVDPRGVLSPLWVSPDGSGLISRDPSRPAAHAFDPESIAVGLREHRLVPSLFLDMLCLVFTEGWNLLGGFNQVQYLNDMRRAHACCRDRLGISIPGLDAPVDGLVCGPLPLGPGLTAFDALRTHNDRGGRWKGIFVGGWTLDDIDKLAFMPFPDLLATGLQAMTHIIE